MVGSHSDLSFFSVFVCRLVNFHVAVFFLRLVGNVLGLCVRAGFEAQSFNLLLKFMRSTKLQVCTSTRLTQNPCYAFAILIFCHNVRQICSLFQCIHSAVCQLQSPLFLLEFVYRKPKQFRLLYTQSCRCRHQLKLQV